MRVTEGLLPPNCQTRELNTSFQKWKGNGYAGFGKEKKKPVPRFGKWGAD